MKRKTQVYLIGAGPGDEGLITKAGFEYLARADVIIYDHLISESILEKKKPEAELIYVGKTPRQHTLAQDKINKLIVQKAKKNKVVVRLKGGDPFLFGRGSEEALALAKAGISFEVVPGVSSGFAAACYAGIPLTHRGMSSQVTFVAGHEDPTKNSNAIDWAQLAKQKGTLVILMGMSRLKQIINTLVQNGMAKKTSVCIVQWGTLPCQKSVAGTLADIMGKVKKTDLTSPAIIIIGEVVNLRKKINWFEAKPLFGKKILITRPSHLAEEFNQKLKSLGAEVVSYPLLELVPILNFKVDSFYERIKRCQWLIFTSRNAVDICFELLKRKNKDARFLDGIKIAALGAVTQERLARKGVIAELVPKKFVMESLISEFKKINIKNKRIFIPHAKEARRILRYELIKQGAIVDELFIYKGRTPKKVKAHKLKQILTNENIDIIAFTSSSCVHNFMRLLGKEKSLLAKQTFAVIGPITQRTLKEYGYSGKIVARVYTIDGLCQAIQNYFK